MNVQIGLYNGEDFIVSGWFNGEIHHLRNFGEHMSSGMRFKEMLYKLDDENVVARYAARYEPDRIYSWQKKKKAFVSRLRKQSQTLTLQSIQTCPQKTSSSQRPT